MKNSSSDVFPPLNVCVLGKPTPDDFYNTVITILNISTGLK